MSQGVDTRLCLPKTAWPPTLKIHLSEVYLAEELETLGVNRFDLIRRLKSEGGTHWKKKGGWIIVSRDCVNHLYPHLNLPEGLDSLFGMEWDKYIPLSRIEQYGLKESDIRNRYDRMPDEMFEIYAVHSEAKRVKTERGYIYIITPAKSDRSHVVREPRS